MRSNGRRVAVTFGVALGAWLAVGVGVARADLTERVTYRARHAVRACYQREFSSAHAEATTIRVTVRVAKDGSVEKAVVAGYSASADACATDDLRSATFNASRDATDAVVEIGSGELRLDRAEVTMTDVKDLVPGAPDAKVTDPAAEDGLGAVAVGWCVDGKGIKPAAVATRAIAKAKSAGWADATVDSATSATPVVHATQRGYALVVTIAPGGPGSGCEGKLAVHAVIDRIPVGAAVALPAAVPLECRDVAPMMPFIDGAQLRQKATNAESGTVSAQYCALPSATLTPAKLADRVSAGLRKAGWNDPEVAEDVPSAGTMTVRARKDALVLSAVVSDDDSACDATSGEVGVKLRVVKYARAISGPLPALDAPWPPLAVGEVSRLVPIPKKVVKATYGPAQWTAASMKIGLCWESSDSAEVAGLFKTSLGEGWGAPVLEPVEGWPGYFRLTAQTPRLALEARIEPVETASCSNQKGQTAIVIHVYRLSR